MDKVLSLLAEAEGLALELGTAEGSLAADKILLLRLGIAFPDGYPLPNYPKLVIVYPARVS